MAKKPTGTEIKRSGNKFTLSWKRKANYTAQQLKWRYSQNGKWSDYTSVSITNTATSKNITLTWSDFYPTKSAIHKLQFSVRGKKSGWSSWATEEIVFEHPDEPTVTAELSSTHTNITDFQWTFETDTTDLKPFANVEWEAVLQDGYSESGIKAIANWSTLDDYRSGTSSNATDTISITESSANIQDGIAVKNGSHTRWFRCRTRGAAGASDWRYAKHVYANPQKAIITQTQAIPTSSGTLVNVNWEVDDGNNAYPIDAVTVRYSLAVPASGLAFPAGGSWTDANVSDDRGKVGAASFEVGTALDKDECLFVQVNTEHDTFTTYGTPTIVRYGELTAPSGLSVSTNDTTYKATVSVSTFGSAVPDSFLAVKYCTAKNPEGIVLGIIAHGQSSVTVQCPNWTGIQKSFTVYAVQGSYTTSTSSGITQYRINPNMISASLNSGGSVPVAPTGVSVTATDIVGTVQVRWDWSWADANAAEISWADHADAWESTNPPNTYEVTTIHASQWNISDLETGVTWYVRVRLIDRDGDNETYGAYSDIQTIDLSSAPTTPILRLSAGVIPANGMTTATWAYITNDGTQQMYAEICEATYVSNTLTYGSKIASTKTAQHIDIYAEDVGWQAGTVHYLCLRVKSASGKLSDSWSDPVPVIIAEPLTASISSTSLTTGSETVDGTTRTFVALDKLPLTVTVSGAGDADSVTVAIERKTDYFLDRPDETEFVGYKGETVAIERRSGSGTVTFTRSGLLGMLDDGALYTIVATINDTLGQSDTAILDFEVAWDHQALVPTANISNYQDVMLITPVAPTGTVTGDTCDIYRLSADKPQLIVEDAAWGTQYVDPYPTIGNYGGYRIVFKSKYGDYITASNELAWTDYGKDEGVYYYTPDTIIDFGDYTAKVKIDMTFSGEWEKDFKETRYLGGSITGDWNKAVGRTGSVKSTTIRYMDVDTIRDLHRLAEYTGICHVRMPDGSNFHANVNVSMDNDYGNAPRTTECTLNITRIDGEGLDGLTYADWSES